LRLTRKILPSLVLLVAVVIAAVPWALPETASFILPLLLIILVFILTVQRGFELPSLSVFAGGLVMDILTAGPLGYWAAIFLLTHTLARLYRDRSAPREFGGLWVAFAGTAIAVSVAGWALASLYFVRIIDWQPMVIASATAIFLFPIIAWPMRHSLGLTNMAIFARRR